MKIHQMSIDYKFPVTDRMEEDEAIAEKNRLNQKFATPLLWFVVEEEACVCG